ncbi:MAG: glycosyltransferase [Lentimicrobiaceae bacterium]|nr:glycosyltransferase [Lentimicrobiaceae bacterium]
MSNYIRDRVIVSLTSIKKREEALRETIECLVRQDYPFHYQVRLNISHEPYLMDDGFEEAPAWIRDLQKVNPKCNLQVRFVRNTGPYRKLLPVLRESFDHKCNDIIVTCDDDTKYPSTWLSTLISYHAKFGGVVAFRGHSIKVDTNVERLCPYSHWQRNREKNYFGLENLPTGKDGILYRPVYFNRGVLDEDRAMKMAPTTDDLWFRWHSILCGVPCYLISLERGGIDNAAALDQEVSLWEIFNKEGGNDQAIRRLEEYFFDNYGNNIYSLLVRYFDYSDNVEGVPVFAEFNDPSFYAARQVRFLSNSDRIKSESLISVFARNYDFLRLRAEVENRYSDENQQLDFDSLPTKIVVAIPTFNRKDCLCRLIKQLDVAAKGLDVYVVVFDDGSREPITTDIFCLENIRGVEVHRFSNHGKQRYWSLVNKIFDRLSELKSDYYFYLGDDLEVGVGFFSESIRVWNSICDPAKVSLNLLRDSRTMSWTNFKSVEMEFCGNTVIKTQWLDMIMIFNKKLLAHRLEEVSLSRWESNPLLSSGVGAQLSKRFHNSGYGMYQVKHSLVYHGDHDSEMNPEDRKINPLVAVGFGVDNQ